MKFGTGARSWARGFSFSKWADQFLYALMLYSTLQGAHSSTKYVNFAGDAPCGSTQMLSPWARQARAINSSLSFKGEFPWMVSFRWSNNGQHFCGGFLIHRRYILSAAHCFVKFTAAVFPFPYRWMEVTIGENNLSDSLENEAVEEIWTHPGFNKSDFRNDIAIIKLTQDVKWSVFKQPLCLPNPSSRSMNNDSDDEDVVSNNSIDNEDEDYYTSQQQAEGLTLQVAGWGSTMDNKDGNSSQSLRKANISPIYKNDACQKAYALSSFHVTDDHLCAGGGPGVLNKDKITSDACYGDSGGYHEFYFSNI